MGPFPAELLSQPKVIYDYDKQSDNGGAEVPVEGTAQNNYAEGKWYKCNDCANVVSESQIETHLCVEYRVEE
jgi:acetyl-CoA carboxylase beta subunit